MRTRTIIPILVGVISIALMGYAPESPAEVSVSIGIGVPAPQVVIPAPPAVVIHAPPPVVVIPGTYVYFAPDLGVDIFFYHGYWYRPYRGHWYRARGYNGPWDNIEGARVPHVVRDLPRDFHHTIRDHQRIHHVDLQKNWKTWEQKKHWDRRDYWDRPDFKHEARDIHDGGRWENSHSRPEVQEVRDNRSWERNQSGPGGRGRPEVWDARDGDVRDDVKQENNQGKPEKRGKHGR